MISAIVSIILIFALLPTMMLAVAKVLKWMVGRTQKAVDTFKSIGGKKGD